jgi:hypothetical protein
MQKKILLGIAIMAIGVIILPQTIAMFAGQHDWYDTTQTGNQAPCEKCHNDINTELSQPGTTNTMHRLMGCDQCHVTTAPNSEGFTKGPGGQFHAAASAACIDCHNTTLLYGTFTHTPAVDALGCLTCHKNPQQFPGNFSAVEILTGSEEVHKSFANQANVARLLKGSNEACISCHTHVRVNITWERATSMEFSATENVVGGIRTWVIGNFNATGSNVTKTSG